MAGDGGGIDYKAYEREILDRLGEEGVVAAFVSMGVEPNGVVRDNGCVECYGYGREDRDPSGFIAANEGKYGDSATGATYSLWEFASQVAKGFSTFQEARDHFAVLAGMEPLNSPKSRGGRPTKAEEQRKRELASFEKVGFFEEWNEGNKRLAHTWCSIYKPGVSVDAILFAGGRVAYWPCFRDKKTKELRRGSYKVLALPAFKPGLNLDKPDAWVIFNLVGPRLEAYHGEGKPSTLERFLSMGSTSATLMNLGDLRKLKEGGQFTLLKTGGPSDMLAAIAKRSAEHAQTHLVLTNASGEAGDVFPDQAAHFAGHHAVYFPDADKTGGLGSAKWLKATAFTTASVRVVSLPFSIQAKKGKDLRDWLNGGDPESPNPHSFADLVALIEATPVSVPDGVLPARAKTTASEIDSDDIDSTSSDADPPAVEIPLSRTAQEEATCKLIGIEVLGELENGGIEIFSLFNRRSTTLPGINHLSYGRLLQLGGPPARDNVAKDGNSTPDKPLPFDEVYNAIATLAGSRRIDQSSKLGAGCWQVTDPKDGPSVVCVGDGRAFQWSGSGEPRIISTPRHGDKILNFASGEEWFDADSLARRLKTPDSTWTVNTLGSVVDVLRQWRWKQPRGAEIAAALIFATWVQTLWTWRPMVAITGASNAGKSTLFEFLSGLYGPLAVKSAGSSPAGLRQRMSTSANAVLCDEFENNRHRQEFLEMLRLSGRGERVLRGTTSHRVQEFVLRHIVWVAAIEVNLPREPDSNRFIMLELMKAEKDKQNKLKLPPQKEMASLGQDTLAAAILHFRRAKQIAEALRVVQVEGVSPRVIESYSVPAAMRAALRGEDEEAAIEWIREVTSEVAAWSPSTPDDTELLRAILRKRIPFGYGRELAVSEILTKTITVDSKEEHPKEQLARLGVKFCCREWKDEDDTTRSGMGLFVSNDLSKDDGLLRDTQWKGQSIKQILSRIPGAVDYRPRLAGVPNRGTWIPREYLEGEGGPLGPCDEEIEENAGEGGF